MAKAKRATKAKSKRPKKDKSLLDRRGKAQAEAKVKAPKVKKPKPTLFEQIGESPIEWGDTKPAKLTLDVLHELDTCHEGIVWAKEYCPRGFPMDEKKMIDVLNKPGASITFHPSWPSWVMNSFLAKAMNTIETDHPHYATVQAHCALVLKSFLREERERRKVSGAHILAGIGSARQMHIDLCTIMIRHYHKL